MASGASSKKNDGLFDGFFHERDCIAIAFVVEFSPESRYRISDYRFISGFQQQGARIAENPYETLFPKTVIPEHIRKGRSGYFEFGEFGKYAFERDSRFEGQRFGV